MELSATFEGKSVMNSSHKPKSHNRGAVIIPICLLLALSGCTVVEAVGRFVGRGVRGFAIERNPSNPFKEIKTVAVLPFILGHNKEPIPPDRAFTYAQAFSSELAQCKGFHVIRAYETAYLQKLQSEGLAQFPISTADQVAQIGRTIQADAVIICKITDYDPYNPPRIGIELQMFRTADYEDFSQTYTNLTSLSRSGGPVVERNAEGKVFIIRFEEIYDLRHDLTRTRLDWYAFSRHGSKSPARMEQYHRESEYIRFVSSELIRKMISLCKKKLKSEAKNN